MTYQQQKAFVSGLSSIFICRFKAKPVQTRSHCPSFWAVFSSNGSIAGLYPTFSTSSGTSDMKNLITNHIR